jgi:lysophospholipase L1-like esterase
MTEVLFQVIDDEDVTVEHTVTDTDVTIVTVGGPGSAGADGQPGTQWVPDDTYPGLFEQVETTSLGDSTFIPNAYRAPAFGSPVTNRGQNRSISTASSNLTETTRVKHVVTENCVGVSLLFFGWYGAETAQSVNATIKAAVEIGGVIHPVAFEGSRTATLVAGFHLRSDVLGLRLVKGDVIYVRVNRTIASGSWTNNVGLLGTTNGEGLTTTDVVDSGTVTAVGGDDTVSVPLTGFTAAGVVSPAPSRGCSVAFLGESIANGTGETSRELGGFMLRCLPDSVGVLRLNNGGQTAQLFVGNTASNSGGRRRYPFFGSCKYAWNQFGGNDMNAAGYSVAQVQADLLKLWNSLADMGLKVYHTTFTLVSSSTDGWTTVENQTPWVKNADRVILNEWFRTVPEPLSGIFDLSAVIETEVNSGIWRVDQGVLTDDGVHPNATGHAYIASQFAAQAAAVFI